MDIMRVYIDLFSSMDYCGPSSPETTKKAFDTIKNRLPEDPVIADLGCGTGGQSLVLATLTGGQFYALDFLKENLVRAEERIAEAGFGDRFQFIHGDMGKLPETLPRFDLIWSEGAIYNIGFEYGLKLWQNQLNPGGIIVVTEATWLTDHPAPELKEAWDREYPAMQHNRENISAIKRAGYDLIDHFVIPESDWLVNFFPPVITRAKKILPRYQHWPEAVAVLEDMIDEERRYRCYSDQYGYVCYIVTPSR